MLELTGIASVLRGILNLYWLLALGTVALALWKGKTKSKKGAGLEISVFGLS